MYPPLEGLMLRWQISSSFISSGTFTDSKIKKTVCESQRRGGSVGKKVTLKSYLKKFFKFFLMNFWTHPRSAGKRAFLPNSLSQALPLVSYCALVTTLIQLEHLRFAYIRQPDPKKIFNISSMLSSSVTRIAI